MRWSDAALAARAEQAASRALSRSGGQQVHVRIHGRPFVRQAVRGRYRDVEVSATNVRLGAFEDVTLHGHLVNARLPLRELLARRATALPCDAVTGSALIPWPELARSSRIPGLVLAPAGRRIEAIATLPVPGLQFPGVGQLARVSGHAHVDLADDRRGVRVSVRRVSVAGIALPALMLSQLVPNLSFRVPLPEPPFGLRIDRLVPMPDGLRVEASASAVTLRRLDSGTSPGIG